MVLYVLCSYICTGFQPKPHSFYINKCMWYISNIAYHSDIFQCFVISYIHGWKFWILNEQKTRCQQQILFSAEVEIVQYWQKSISNSHGDISADLIAFSTFIDASNCINERHFLSRVLLSYTRWVSDIRKIIFLHTYSMYVGIWAIMLA